MCKCMGWMGASISMSRSSCNLVARTRSDGQKLGGSRRSSSFDYAMTYMNRDGLLSEPFDEFAADPRKPAPKPMLSGFGAVVL